jgi:hypothetical protein
VVVKDQVTSKVASNLRYSNKEIEEDGKSVEKEDKREMNETDGTKESKDQAAISGEDVNIFDSKECESGKPGNSGTPCSENPSQVESRGLMNCQNSTKDCWLCAWNIPNETSLALLIIIVACLVLVLKVVLSNNVYMFVILMATVGCFTYYQVARNIQHSS